MISFYDICCNNIFVEMNKKPSIPKGTRDFSSKEIAKRSYVLSVIERSFKNFGFLPIETPAMENLETLLGKYGDEGDRLIFKILNSGDYIAKIDFNENVNSQGLTKQISSKALRYDLTVPFARYVAQNRNEITFPFKRYQMQTVWRADRPQKGRFREFYQCDADIVGSESLVNEVELISLYDQVFTELGFTDFSICINNRKLLSALSEVIGEEDKLIDFTIALDKIDKIGVDGVVKEMIMKGISQRAIEKISPLFNLQGTNIQILNEIKKLVGSSEVGRKGIEEIEWVLQRVSEIGLRQATLELNLTLARGLNYYTGSILEVKTNEVEIGSIGGGGRYDDLTGIFGLNNISGVGISFGLDRICLALDELSIFPDFINQNTEVMFVNFSEDQQVYCLKLLNKIRSAGISAELYPDPVKVKKQMNYANKKNVSYVILIGSDEIQNSTVVVKNMKDGDQITMDANKLVDFLYNKCSC